MREAIKLAEDGMRGGRGGPFGCVVVRRGEIVGRGSNRVTSTNDPTAHAEVTAIRDACAKLQTFQLADCELYTSCEPCPMCAGAAMWARVDRVVFASTRDDARQYGRFDDDDFWDDLVRPVDDRALEHTQVGRDLAVEVWKWFAEHHADLHY